MKPPLTFSPRNVCRTKQKFSIQFAISNKLKRRQAPVARFAALLMLLALAIFSGSYVTSSAATREGQAANTDAKLATDASMLSTLRRFFPLALMPQAGPETIKLYAVDGLGNCTNTEKTEFEFGEVACARVTNVPAGLVRRIVWVDPNGFIEKSTPITADGQTDNWTNPSTASGLIAGFFTVENRGTWRASIATGRGSVMASAFYTLKDPVNASANLSINLTALGVDSPVTGGQVQFLVRVINEGPDAATNVHVKDENFFNITLDSATQTSGSAFNCTSSGSLDCSIASLPKGGTAEFLLNFTAGSAGSVINNTATTSTDTTELVATDNESSSQPIRIVTGGAPPACILSCPSNMTVTADATLNGDSGAYVTYGAAEEAGTCGSSSYSIPSGSFFKAGQPTVVSSTSTQGNGSCSFTVNVIEIPMPTLTCPADITDAQAPDGACEATVSVGAPTNVTGQNVEVTGARNDSQPLDAPYPGGTTTITWTVTDDLNRSVSCTQTVHVTVNDTTKPTITAPPDLTLTTDGSSCGVVVNQASLTPDADDNCAVTSVSSSGIPAGNFFHSGTTTITYTAKDAAGNTATATQTVTVTGSDGAAPVVRLNGDDPNTEEFDPPTETTIECGTAFTGPGATAVDNCLGTVPVTASVVNVNAYTYQIVYSATDGTNVGTAVFTVHLLDTTPPVITCPADVTSLLPANSTATSMAVNFTVTATDSCNSNVTVTSTPASGSVFQLGKTTVSSFATDGVGLTSPTCTFDVYVLYRFTGFFQPVANQPTVNVVNAGRAIPVKFSLSGNKGLNIFAPNYPASGVVACNSSDPVVNLTDTVTAGGSSLSYDASSDQYNYVWKTESSWAGTCRQLVIKLNDGTEHRANFKFK